MISLIRILPNNFREQYRENWQSLKIEAKVFLGKLKRQFARPAFPSCSEINLNLGCGSIDHPKFINIDGLPASHIHYIRAIDDLAPFENEKVDLIYASHCLEHFRYKAVDRVLEEWFRVLKRGGILRLSVPDFDKLLKVYFDNDQEVDTIIPQLLAGQQGKYDYHLNYFNEKKLTRLLKSAGFREVRAWIPDSDENTTFDDFSVYRIEIGDKSYPVSLNLEAFK